MRLINADKLKFKHKCHYGEHTTRPYTLFCISFEEIQKAPTIKAVPIEVLDKIRAELHATAEMHEDENYYLRDEWIDEIIDKYKAGSEEE